MLSRLKGLERLASLYRAVKHAEGLSLQQAAASLRQAEAKIEQQQARVKRANVAGRESLNAGDHTAWQMQESQRQFLEWNAERLLRLRSRREEQMLAAAEVYQASRMQLEQLERVLEDLRATLELDRAHAAQRESDDRFLSRQRWAARRGELRAGFEPGAFPIDRFAKDDDTSHE